jgi:methionyl-tRNA formyltransferase
MTICIAGKNEIATGCTDWLLNNRLVDKKNLLVCLNKTDEGVDTFQRSFKKHAEQNNLIISSVEQLYKIQNLVFFSLEFDRIIKPEKFTSQKLYNIHFSLLPKYKGMYTSSWPLLNGEKTSGVTLHLIDQGIDTGDIIDQVEFTIEENDSCRDLYFKYTQHAIDLFKKNFNRVLQNEYETHKQSFRDSSYYSKSSIDYSKFSIDLNKTAEETRNQIRAVTFKEYQLPTVHGYRIISAKILKSSTRTKPGTILYDSDLYVDISTIDYDLRLMKEMF